MGGSLSRLWSLVWTKKEIRILILGLVCVLMNGQGASFALQNKLLIGLAALRITLERPLSSTDLR